MTEPNIEDSTIQEGASCIIRDTHQLSERGRDLNEQRQPVRELAAMLEAALAHDEMPQNLFDVVVDYFQAKIASAGLAPTIPEISQRPVMEMVLAAERRQELFAEHQEKARLKSPTIEATRRGRGDDSERGCALMQEPNTTTQSAAADSPEVGAKRADDEQHPTGRRKRMLINRKEFAELAGISVASLDRLLRDRKVSCVRLPGRVLFSEKHLEEFIARHGRPAREWKVFSPRYLGKPALNRSVNRPRSKE